eukprot:snap_masked-scaffold_18-processed-gene-1.31-mRNA-1 protein AED:1.00 eAED:1.00 QI:0/-1/0/0/-1/1/1/0/61
METIFKKLKNFIRKNKMVIKEVDEMFTNELKLMGSCWNGEELRERRFVFNDSTSRLRRHFL